MTVRSYEGAHWVGDAAGVVRNNTKQTRWPMSSSKLLRAEMTSDLVLIPLASLSLFLVSVHLLLTGGSE